MLNFLKHVDDVLKEKVVYCYSVYQPLYDEIKHARPGVIFVEGFPSYIESIYLSNPNFHDLLIIDDLLDMIADDKMFRDTYLFNSHHKNYSVITVVQNLYYKSKYLRTASLQCSGFLLFKCFRDRSMITNLARQISPNMFKSSIEMYDKISSHPYSYMFIDFSPGSHPMLWYRGNILPKGEMDVYVTSE